jgi:hypothetical protein
MKSIPRAFWHEFRGAFARLPVWLPGTRMRLGDVGLLSTAGWAPVSTLADQGVSFEQGEPGVPVDYDYRSVGGTAVSVHMAVDSGPLLTPAVDVGSAVRYSFSRQGAFVLKASAVRARQITNLDEVAAQVCARYRAGLWERTWTVVTEVGLSGPGMILVSGQVGAEATVEFGAAAPGTGIGARIGIRVSHENGLAAAFISNRPGTLMWAGRYVHDPRFGRTRFQVRGPDRPAADETFSFDERHGPEWPREGIARTD